MSHRDNARRVTLRASARSLIATASAVALLSTLLALPALAHPFIRGGQAPVDSLAEMTLAMAHGCGTEQAGGGEPTLEVAIEIPEWMRLVDAVAPEGWQVATEIVDGETTVVWTAIDAREPAPDLTFSAVLSGTPGETRYLKVFQGCDGFSYRWVGTPDEPAPDPAIRITLAEPDPDAPPPAVEEPAVEPDEPEEASADEPGHGSDSPEASEQPGEPEDAQPIDEDADEPAAANEVADSAGIPVAIWVATGALLVAIVVAGLTVRRRRRDTTG